METDYNKKKHPPYTPTPASSLSYTLPHFSLRSQSRERRIRPVRGHLCLGRWRWIGSKWSPCGVSTNSFCLWLLLLISHISNQASAFFRSLSWGLFQEPLTLLTPLWTKPCMYLSSAQSPPSWVRLLKLGPMSRMLYQTQGLGHGSRGWREVKIIAQFQAFTRLSEFSNP